MEKTTMKLARALALPLGALAMGGQAFAADAIMMEPEPVEYVRVCDAYGSGFFYIPGTETCLRISGYVRYTIGATGDDGLTDTPNWLGFAPDEWNKGSRARVNFDARSETEWGTLRSFIRLQASATSFGVSADQPVLLDLGYIQLGGVAMGYMQSAWAGTFNGGDSNDGTFTDDGFDYGDQYRQIVQYNFGGRDGFFATFSLENDPGTANYVPDIVGKVGYAAAWGTLHAILGYDEDLVDSGGIAGSDAFAVRVGGHFKLGERAAFKLHGFYNDDETGFNSYWSTAEWSIQAALGYQLTDNVFVSLGGQYWSDLTPTAFGGLPLGFVPGRDAWGLDGGVVWEPVKNLEIRAEANYVKAEDHDGSLGGFVWFLRSF
jgi:hypothetical protein